MSTNPISIRSYWIKKKSKFTKRNMAKWKKDQKKYKKRLKKYEKKSPSTVCQFNQMKFKRIFFNRLTSQLRLKCCSLLVKSNRVSFRTFAFFLANRTTHVNGNICSQVSILFHLGCIPFFDLPWILLIIIFYCQQSNFLCKELFILVFSWKENMYAI